MSVFKSMSNFANSENEAPLKIYYITVKYEGKEYVVINRDPSPAAFYNLAFAKSVFSDHYRDLPNGQSGALILMLQLLLLQPCIIELDPKSAVDILEEWKVKTSHRFFHEPITGTKEWTLREVRTGFIASFIKLDILKDLNFEAPSAELLKEMEDAAKSKRSTNTSSMN